MASKLAGVRGSIRKWMHMYTADAPVRAQSKREKAERENEDLRMKYEILKSRLGCSDL
jgi:hypothetical protein